MNRGYDKDGVQTLIDKVTKLDRVTLLQFIQVKTPLDRVPMIVTYHLCLFLLKSILKKYLPILNVSHHLN